MKPFGTGNEVRVGNYARRKGISSRSFGTSTYVPRKVPNDVTKENMKTAIEANFAEFIEGDDDALLNLCAILKVVKSRNWEVFNYKTTKERIGVYKINSTWEIKDFKLNLEINLKNGQRQRVIRDENFEPGNSDMPKRLFELWKMANQVYNT